MIKVYVKKQRDYPVSSAKIKTVLANFFTLQGISSNADVNVMLLGKRKMESLGKKYLSKNEPVHNVLSFASSESGAKFISPPDNILHLGDIVVCYPVAVTEANRDGVLIDKKVIELLKHGAYHLLGIHHK